MKKKVRIAPNNPYYTSEPAVSRKLIAGSTPVQNASLGNKPPKMVDAHPGRLSGIANFASKSRPSAKPMTAVSVKTPGAKAPPVSTHLKASGHPQAHQLGSIKPIKLKV